MMRFSWLPPKKSKLDQGTKFKPKKRPNSIKEWIETREKETFTEEIFKDKVIEELPSMEVQ